MYVFLLLVKFRFHHFLFKVTLLESSGRRGGRMKTYRGKTKQGEEWYGDLGAMRFPGLEGQPIINKVI